MREKPSTSEPWQTTSGPCSTPAATTNRSHRPPSMPTAKLTDPAEHTQAPAAASGALAWNPIGRGTRPNYSPLPGGERGRFSTRLGNGRWWITAGIGASVAAVGAFKLQRRLVAIEDDRYTTERNDRRQAWVSMRVDRRSRLRMDHGQLSDDDEWYLTLENQGQAAARNVALTVTGADGEDASRLLSLYEGEFPLSVLDPGATYSVGMLALLAGPHRLIAETEWADEVQKNRHAVPLRIG